MKVQGQNRPSHYFLHHISMAAGQRFMQFSWRRGPVDRLTFPLRPLHSFSLCWSSSRIRSWSTEHINPRGNAMAEDVPSYETRSPVPNYPSIISALSFAFPSISASLARSIGALKKRESQIGDTRTWHSEHRNIHLIVFHTFCTHVEFTCRQRLIIRRPSASRIRSWSASV
jgi:hypothetical protein